MKTLFWGGVFGLVGSLVFTLILFAINPIAGGVFLGVIAYKFFTGLMNTYSGAIARSASQQTSAPKKSN